MYLKRILICLFIIISLISCIGFQTPLQYNANAEIDKNNVTDHESDLFDPSVFQNLDYGIYWCGPEYQYEKAVEGKKDYTYYDPTKPTMIFIHGYQSNSGYFQRETLQVFSSIETPGLTGLQRYTAKMWIDKGYNVAQFFWNQISDDQTSAIFPNPVKIWSTDLGMCWKKSDGKLTEKNDSSNPTVSVSELFVQEYIKAMKNYKGPEIRIVGHSMGSEIATAGSYLLNEMKKANKLDKALMPKRVSLLDPYTAYSFTNNDFNLSWNNENTNGRTIYELMTEYLEILSNDGIAIDGYAGMSLAYRIFMQNSNTEKMIETYKRFLNAVTWVYLDGLYDIYSADSATLHCSARDWYLLSINNDIKDTTYDGSNNIGISASTPTDYVYAMKGTTYSQSDTGNRTFLLDNDYEIQVKLTEITNVADTKVINKETIPTGIISGKVQLNKSLKDGYKYLNGYSGMTVNLLDNSGNVLSTTETDDNGWYTFKNLSAGSYYVQFDKSSAVSFYKGDSDLNATYYYTDVTEFDLGKTKEIILASDHSIMTANCIVNNTASYIFAIIISLILALTITFTVTLLVKKNKHNKAVITL